MLLNLYYAFSYPFLIYCNITWASNYPSNLRKITVLRKRIIRLITFSDFRAPSLPLFSNLKLLNIQQICYLQTGLFMHKYYFDQLPQIFHGLFTPNQEIHSHYTRQSHLLHHFQVHSNIAKFAIKHNGPKIWNNIPPHIKVPNFRAFKKQLQLFLLNS